MIFIGIGRYRWWWIAGEIAAVMLLGALCTLLARFGMGASAVGVLAAAAWGVLVGSLLVLGRRDIGFLFRKPAKNMGTGLSRIWSVGHTTMLEAWAGRIWLLPLLWLGAAFIMMGSVRIVDLPDRIPQYIRMLLTSQELLLLVMMWVMACVSLPREREKKIVITNASKPLSRLEIVLGKMAGFSAMAGVMVVVMGAASLLILYVSNERLKASAREQLALSKSDTARLSRATLEALSEEGQLHAYNYITVAKGGMSILGEFRLEIPGGMERFIKGNSAEVAVYEFQQLNVDRSAYLAPVGTRPYFIFFFPVAASQEGVTATPEIRVSAYCSSPDRAEPPRRQEKTLRLTPAGYATWEPENPEQLFSSVDETGQPVNLGPVTVEVSTTTPGALLQVLDGLHPEKGEAPNVGFVQDRRTGFGPAPAPRPMVRGMERHDAEELVGPTRNDPLGEYAVYRFDADTLRHVPVKNGNFQLTLLLDTFKQDNATVPTEISLAVFSADNGDSKPYQLPHLEVTEKRAMTLEIPAVNLGAADASQRGDMYVWIQATTLGHAVVLGEDSVRIELPATPFAVNWFKSEAVLLLETMLMIVVSVACSVRLGWAVAMFLSGIVFLFGYFVDFIVGIQEYGGLAVLNYHANGAASGIFTFFDTTTDWLWRGLGVVARMSPNFSEYQAQQFIPDLRNMPWGVLGGNLLDTVLFMLPVVAIAYLMARKQELG